jgi:hypothetical protein
MPRAMKHVGVPLVLAVKDDAHSAPPPHQAFFQERANRRTPARCPSTEGRHAYGDLDLLGFTKGAQTAYWQHTGSILAAYWLPLAPAARREPADGRQLPRT